MNALFPQRMLPTSHCLPELQPRMMLHFLCTLLIQFLLPSLIPPQKPPLPALVSDSLAADVGCPSPQNLISPPQQLASPTAAPLPSTSTIPPLDIASEPPILTISAPLPHPMLTRSRTGSSQPKQFPKFQMYYASNHPPSTLPSHLALQEPSCYTKVATNPH